MIRLLLTKAWPALIPLGLYLVWYIWQRRRAIKEDAPLPPVLSGPWRITIAACLLILAICLFAVGLSAERNAGVSYQPQRYIDGQLIDDELQPRQP